MSTAYAQIAKVGPVEVDTGNGYLDIIGVIVICLVLAAGYAWIKKRIG